MDSTSELYAIYSTLVETAALAKQPHILEIFESVENAVEKARIASSDSWLGYQAQVYYTNLEPPPAGANFSSEWGLIATYGDYGTTGNWREYKHETVKQLIFSAANNPDLNKLAVLSETAADTFDSAKSEILSILHSEPKYAEDKIIQKAISNIEKNRKLLPHDIISRFAPKGEYFTRDNIAMNQGQRTPPHIEVAATMLSLRSSFIASETVAKECKKAASHIKRLSKVNNQESTQGNMIFIGHGQSPLWRELKDFIHERLHLEWDEFNRIPVAGVTNISRLSDMLNSASFALIVLTGEDERADGAIQARMNVIHEAGLFQGKLGFNKAILLLEEGCEEFSNIQGLNQIRFPKGNISAAFEQIRATLEREGHISSR